MVDTPGTPLVPSRDSRLNPADVAERSFSQVKRGYAENEVRAYLRLVADELASALSRARDLAARVESLEDLHVVARQVQLVRRVQPDHCAGTAGQRRCPPRCSRGAADRSADRIGRRDGDARGGVLRDAGPRQPQ